MPPLHGGGGWGRDRAPSAPPSSSTTSAARVSHTPQRLSLVGSGSAAPQKQRGENREPSHSREEAPAERMGYPPHPLVRVPVKKKKKVLLA